ncbi:ABC transporter permease subunit [Paludicola sp. MB14-C6]|uniref:ABC transporter permease subunit n=1 Tax=Paludihabitans sp. MB14-C6 TaxID=3070656 RepID=UPI0027DCE8EC|nr:ABC transporter permease subunit [Paludicola sp. MB14-C6]WMJ24062.1 ABC transporter permease subunit [Paludicola sp. MB14-C6]
MAKVKAEKIKSKKFTFDDFELILLSLPTVIWYALFSFLPMIGVIIAFKTYRIQAGKGFLVSLFQSEWSGFKNFEYLFKTKDTFIMLRNTILYNVFFIILGIIIPVTLAIMITNLYSQKYAKVCQTAMFLPHFMSWVVASYFLVAFLDTQKGMIPNLILSMTGEQISFYSSEESTKYWPYILTIMRLWKGTGYGMVVYLASITGIDGTYYEAAVIDGATKWQQVKSITIPLLKPIIIILFIMDVGRIFSSDFGLFYQVPRNQGAIQDATLTIDVYVFNALKNLNNIGMSSAAAFFQSVCGCFMILIANSIVKKVDEESAFF